MREKGKEERRKVGRMLVREGGRKKEGRRDGGRERGRKG